MPVALHPLADVFAETVRIVLYHPAVYIDNGKAVVDVDVTPVMNVWPRAADPAAAVPAMVVDTVPVPVAIPVEPDADGEPGTEGDEPV